MKYEYLKGSEKDFEGAPEWCTHVSKSPSKGWIAWEQAGESKKGNMYQWNDGESPVSTYEGGGMRLNIIAERQPITEPEWDGVGLPPVGCEFEYQDHNGKFIRATMDYCGKNFAIVHYSDSGDSWLRLTGAKFRPLRTEADKKREAICTAIYGALTKAEREHNRSDEADAVYDAIAAGKIPGVKLED